MSSLDPDTYGAEKHDQYHKIQSLGEGRYAQVFKYRHIKTGEIVAIKRLYKGKYRDGINVAAVCEVQVLQELHHPNIIKLFDVFPLKDRINCVLEYCTTDLERIIADPSLTLTPADVKSFMQMLLKGLAHCHACWILHRDLKTNNLLVGADGQLKICDFGMARPFGSPEHKLAHQVVTLWYRAPELLFGAREYGVGVDMWSVGCIFAELLLRKHFFPGASELDQLGKIFHALGVPTEKEWPGVSKLPAYMPFTAQKPTEWQTMFPAASADALDLLKQFFKWVPSERITAAEALKHPYFSNDPAPTLPDKLPRPRHVETQEAVEAVNKQGRAATAVAQLTSLGVLKSNGAGSGAGAGAGAGAGSSTVPRLSLGGSNAASGKGGPSASRAPGTGSGVAMRLQFG